MPEVILMRYLFADAANVRKKLFCCGKGGCGFMRRNKNTVPSGGRGTVVDFLIGK